MQCNRKHAHVYASHSAKEIVLKDLTIPLFQVKLDVVIATYFALSVESWKYRDTQSYMTVSAHFIKDSWEMSSIVLETFDCTEERTGSDIVWVKCSEKK